VRVHHGYFGVLGANYAGHVGDHIVIYMEPGCELAVGDVGEVAEDTFCCPRVEVLLHVFLSQSWLETERVAT
jgi:hypothetical protein